jgi:hypothetical protein
MWVMCRRSGCQAPGILNKYPVHIWSELELVWVMFQEECSLCSCSLYGKAVSVLIKQDV